MKESNLRARVLSDMLECILGIVNHVTDTKCEEIESRRKRLSEIQRGGKYVGGEMKLVRTRRGDPDRQLMTVGGRDLIHPQLVLDAMLANTDESRH